jgi:hypothetical protein
MDVKYIPTMPINEKFITQRSTSRVIAMERRNKELKNIDKTKSKKCCLKKNKII